MRFFPSRRKRLAPDESSKTPEDRGAPKKQVEPPLSAGNQAIPTGEAEEKAGSPDPQRLGPYNEGEAPKDSMFFDAGVMHIPVIDGLHISPVMGGTDSILALELVAGTAQMQVAVCAMQRSGGLWDEIRQELADQLESEEYRIFPLPGPFGEAVLARPIPGGKSDVEGALPLLLWGVEGDRWLLRVILRGQAAEEESARQDLLKILHGMEIVRGDEAHMPGEFIPIRLAPDLREQLGACWQ